MSKPAPRRGRAIAALLLLPLLAGAAWDLWAKHQYRGLDACPTGTQVGHPYLMIAGVILLGAAVMSTAPRWASTSRRATALMTIATAVLTAAVIMVVWLGVAGSLRCFD